MKCPVCSADATGTFCSGCGATLTALRCPSCEADVRAGARFCHACGHSVGSHPGRRAGLAWIVAGGTLATLAAVLLVRLTASGSAATSAAGPGDSPAVTDISNMSPRERADRLYNRVMAASERGDSTEVAFFGPMALQAYDLLGGFDADSRYHVGMMHLILRDAKAARAQADSISRIDKNHLLASLLKAEIARRAADAAARNRAWRDLLAHYDAEIATGKPEYADHRTALENARDEARKATGGGSR